MNSNDMIRKIDPHRYDPNFIYNPYTSNMFTNHYHTYNLTTDNTYDHNHIVSGQTINTININGSHVHSFKVKIETDNDFHDIFGETGPAVKTESGHKHFIKGMTSIDKNHMHYFEGYTSTNSTNQKK